jgi:uncharacterized protein
MKRKSNKAKKAAVLAVLIFTIGLFLGGYANPPKIVSETQIIYAEKPAMQDSTTVSLKVPAVDNEGNGVATILSVQAIENGSGKVLVNVDRLLFWVDTQYSIQTARSVAQNITGKDLSGYDLVYTINANATAVEGGSAGAALAIATIAALDNLTLKEDVIITGTINPDGTIGPIGGVAEKAKAAKDIGMNVFLIPSANKYEYKYRTEEQCETIPGGRFCTIKTVPVKEPLEGGGIDIEQVDNISQALEYFVD